MKLTFACCGLTFFSSSTSKSLLVPTRMQLAETVYLSMSCFQEESCSKASYSLGRGKREGRGRSVVETGEQRQKLDYIGTREALSVCEVVPVQAGCTYWTVNGIDQHCTISASVEVGCNRTIPLMASGITLEYVRRRGWE